MRAPDFWLKEGPLSVLLAPLGWFWAMGAWFRTFGSGRRAPVPVICIGNLTAGGAGKTPVALSIARMIEDAYFLSKGYGGSEKGPVRVDPERHHYDQVGDEPLLLAETAPCWVAKDRIAGAQAAAHAGARCLIMDDGFQDPSLAKTVSLVVVDGATGFGNERCMPAGPLREPISMGLKRADAVVIVGDDKHRIARRVHPKPVLRAWLEPQAEAGVLAGKKVVAFAGIGRPSKFFHTIEQVGGRIVEGYAFPDHYPYHPAQIGELQVAAQAMGAYLVTTAKDSVRIPAHLKENIGALEMDVTWQDEAALMAVLAPALKGHPRL